MESSLNEYEQKIIKVLQQFLIPDYKIGNDTYLEILLSQISGKYDAGLLKFITLLNLIIFKSFHLFFIYILSIIISV